MCEGPLEGGPTPLRNFAATPLFALCLFRGLRRHSAYIGAGEQNSNTFAPYHRVTVLKAGNTATFMGKVQVMDRTPLGPFLRVPYRCGENTPPPGQTFGRATSLSVLSTLAFDNGLHGLLRLSLTFVSTAPHHLQRWRAIAIQ